MMRPENTVFQALRTNFVSGYRSYFKGAARSLQFFAARPFLAFSRIAWGKEEWILKNQKIIIAKNYIRISKLFEKKYLKKFCCHFFKFLIFYVTFLCFNNWILNFFQFLIRMRRYLVLFSLPCVLIVPIILYQTALFSNGSREENVYASTGSIKRSVGKFWKCSLFQFSFSGRASSLWRRPDKSQHYRTNFIDWYGTSETDYETGL